jgi:RNA polymerase sigma factor (sigma-70 family)
MAKKQLDAVVRFVRRLADVAAADRLPDAELLQRFTVAGEETAFAALMRRHETLVWGVCRRVLHHHQDAEDAFQTTFLTLARRAGYIRKQESVASWLHGVAYHIATKARRDADTRRARMRREERMGADDPVSEAVLREALAVLDEEVQHLSARYRSVFVLCCLEGKSLDEAARQLGWKQGTVSGTLARARQQLQRRLARRGVTLPAILWGILLYQQAVEAAVPRLLAAATLRAALSSGAGVPAAVEGIAMGAADIVRRESTSKGGVTSMSAVRAKVMAGILLTAGVLSAGVRWRTEAPVLAEQGPPVVQPGGSTAAALGAAKPRTTKSEATYGGTVLNAVSGKPVAGVKVVVRWLVGGRTEGEAKLVSDNSGRFRFDSLPGQKSGQNGEVEVSVEAPPGFIGSPALYPGFYYDSHWIKSPSSVPIEALRRGAEQRIPPYFDRVLLFPSKEVSGRLLTPDSKPAADVDIVACSVPLKDDFSHHVIRRTKTGADGRFKAEVASPGPVVLYFLPEQYAARYVKLTDPGIDLGTYRLEAGVEVNGKLSDAKGRRLEGQWVYIGLLNTPEADHELWSVGLGGFGRWCRSGPGGTFRTAPLPPGEFFATVHGPGHDRFRDRELTGRPLESCFVPQKVTVRPGGAEVVVLNAVPHVNVELKVVDRDGKPKADTWVGVISYYFDGKYIPASSDYSPRTDQDGRVLLQVPHGATFVQLGRNYESADIYSFRPGEGTKIDRYGGSYLWIDKAEADRSFEVRWERGAEAWLHVAGKDGSAIKNLEIRAQNGDGSHVIVLPRGEGFFQLKGSLKADLPCTVTAKAHGYKEATTTIKLPAGALKRIDMTLEKYK